LGIYPRRGGNWNDIAIANSFVVSAIKRPV
jgi:hypothetical protein